MSHKTHRISVGTLLPILQGHIPRRYVGSPAQMTPKQDRNGYQQANSQPFHAVPPEMILRRLGF
jgi:hypothetical protein